MGRMHATGRIGRAVAAMIAASGAAVALSGCFTIVDVGRFESAAGRDLVLHLRNMVPHASHRMEFLVVDATDNLQSWARVEPLGSPDYDLVMPKALASPPYKIKFYADPARDGYTPFTPPETPMDHQWIVDVPLGGELTFTHNTNFVSLGSVPSGSGQVSVTVQGIPMSGIDQRCEARVIEAETGRTRVLIRDQSAEAASITLEARGVFDLETDYDVDVWVDTNGNGHYDPPGAGGDLAVRTVVTPLLTPEVVTTVDVSADPPTDVGF